MHVRPGFGPATLLAALLIASAGCQAEDEEPGQIRVALSASAGGVTYRLPAGTQLEILSANPQSFPLDGDDTIVQITLPSGNYGYTLSHPNGYTTAWPLERTNGDGSVVVVDSTLLTPLPGSVSVAAGQSVFVTFQFSVGGTEVVFDDGELLFDVDVSEGPRFAFLSHTGSLNVIRNTVSPKAPADLAGRLPQESTFANVFLEGAQSGFVELQEDGLACAPFAKTSLTVTGTDPVRLEAILTESFDQPRFCITTFAGAVRVLIEVTREGAPLTPTFADLGESFIFRTRYHAGDLESTNGRVDLQQLVDGQLAPAAMTIEVFDGFSRELLARTELVGQAFLSLDPRF